MTYRKSFRLILVSAVILAAFTGCKKQQNEYLSGSQDAGAIKSENTADSVTNNTSEPMADNKNTVDIPNENGIEFSENEVDYSDYFEGLEGTAVFYNNRKDTYYIYNTELANRQSSPCSSFKIISCLMGLESGVIDPVDSTMKWNGTVYPVKDWNQDMDYKQAFKCSGIWYFRKVIDLAGKDYAKDILKSLDYGNQDISQWEGGSINKDSNGNVIKELNGFWLESSLEISPRQQVDVMKKIFEEKDIFSDSNTDLLKEVMQIDNDSNIHIYGKTGSGKKDDTWSDAWFVGFLEKDKETTYFAIRLNSPESTGSKAKEIAVKIINREFGQ